MEETHSNTVNEADNSTVASLAKADKKCSKEHRHMISGYSLAPRVSRGVH